jgi:hypothetical protein
MSDAVPGSARKCARCGRSIAPRREGPACYCPVCGFRLTPLHVEVNLALTGAPKTAATAIAALVFGLLAFIPMCGVPLGLVAIGLGISAGQRISVSGGRLGGQGLAVAGIVLGVIGCLLWTLTCIGLG